MRRAHPPLILAMVLMAASAGANGQPVLITTPTTVNSSDTHLFGVPLSTADITVRGTTLTVNGVHTIRSLVIERLGVVTHSAAAPELNLSVSGDCTIRGAELPIESGIIDVSAKGFPAAAGPGAGFSKAFAASGAGHAGPGGEAGPDSQPGGVDYGSTLTPAELGSGGGNAGPQRGGAGGGCVRLTVQGELRIDGRIHASGSVGASGGGHFAGGGSGGSIWISAGNLTGIGEIQATGGTAPGIAGGGAGGRIAIYAADDQFSGRVAACGGSGFSAGAVGTIVRADAAGEIDITLSNCGVEPAGPTRLFNLPVRDISLSDNALVQIWQTTPLRDIVVTRGAQLSVAGASQARSISMRGPSGLVLEGPMILGHVQLERDPISGGGPSVDLRGRYQVSSFIMGSGLVYSGIRQGHDGLDIRSDGDIVIEAPARILLDGAGNISALGEGAPRGVAQFGAGAGHGGGGGASESGMAGGGAFGVPERPESLGSGGGPGAHPVSLGGPGGGYLRLTASGTIMLDGTVSVRGGSGWSVDGLSSGGGGGSGGSVWLFAPAVIGDGFIDACGGDGANLYRSDSARCGGGSGGRIGVFSFARALPESHLIVNGGGGYLPGEPGSVFFGSSSIALLDEPSGGSHRSGRFIELSVEARGDGPLTLQWRRQGVPIEEGFDGRFYGVRGNVLSIDDLRCEDSGMFDCVISDSHGGFATPPAQIVVVPASDLTGDGTVDGQDVEEFFVAWEAGGAVADLNDDGGIDGADVGYFFEHWERGC